MRGQGGFGPQAPFTEESSPRQPRASSPQLCAHPYSVILLLFTLEWAEMPTQDLMCTLLGHLGQTHTRLPHHRVLAKSTFQSTFRRVWTVLDLPTVVYSKYTSTPDSAQNEYSTVQS